MSLGSDIIEFFRSYGPQTAMATFLLTALAGIIAQWRFSRFLQDRYGEDMPSTTFDDRTKGLVTGLRILFSREPHAPVAVKIISSLYRLLWLLLIAELVFMWWTRESV